MYIQFNGAKVNILIKVFGTTLTDPLKSSVTIDSEH